MGHPAKKLFGIFFEIWPNLLFSGPGTLWDRFPVSENPRVKIFQPDWLEWCGPRPHKILFKRIGIRHPRQQLIQIWVSVIKSWISININLKTTRTIHHLEWNLPLSESSILENRTDLGKLIRLVSKMLMLQLFPSHRLRVKLSVLRIRTNWRQMD